jgi:hypothetical protein
MNKNISIPVLVICTLLYSLPARSTALDLPTGIHNDTSGMGGIGNTMSSPQEDSLKEVLRKHFAHVPIISVTCSSDMTVKTLMAEVSRITKYDFVFQNIDSLLAGYLIGEVQTSLANLLIVLFYHWDGANIEVRDHTVFISRRLKT